MVITDVFSRVARPLWPTLGDATVLPAAETNTGICVCVRVPGAGGEGVGVHMHNGS